MVYGMRILYKPWTMMPWGLFKEELYDEVWDTASPWYDSDLQDNFIGFQLSRNFSLDSLQKFKEEIENAEAAFFARFGIKGYVQAVPSVY